MNIVQFFSKFPRASVITVSLLLSVSSAFAATELPLDLETSTLRWKGTKVSGSHTGTLGIKEGSVMIEDGKPVSGSFTFDMKSISNSDLEDPAYRTKLENHLKSDDFFDVQQYESATFVISKLTPVADTAGEYLVDGILTIKGISHPIQFTTTITETESDYTASSNLKFDRTRWNVKYNSGKFFDLANLGDKLIYDEIEVSFLVRAPRG